MDEYAFPVSRDVSPSNTGMTLRDYFAAKAMQADCIQNPYMFSEVAAIRAYEMADAMLKQRVK